MKIIKISQISLVVSLFSLSLLASVQADTYVYEKSDGITLLTDKKVKKKGYKLKRVYKNTFFKKKKSTKRKKSRGYRIGCGRLSASQIDKKTRPYLHEIKKYSKIYGVDVNLVRAIIRQESCFKPKAKSRVGAMGLMQLMPNTAKYLGITSPWKTDQNIKGGVKYISRQLKRFKGDKRLALAAYNAGPGAVLKYKGIPPYRETQNYVGSIMEEYQRLEKHHYTRKMPTLSRKAKMDDDFHIFWGKQ